MGGRACGSGAVSNVRVEGALQRPTSAFRDWIAAGEISPFQPEAGAPLSSLRVASAPAMFSNCSAVDSLAA